MELIVVLGIVVVAILVAVYYEIKHTYRDGDLWKK